jgi:hypothetical protein
MQVPFDFIPMSNQNITLGTIAGGIVQVNWIVRVDMNHERHFLLRCLAFALRTTSKANVAIWVEEEFIACGELAKEVGFGHIFRSLFTISPFLLAQHTGANLN